MLCSLLLGAGFDAYMVAGYAPLALTVSDQTGAICPLLESETTPKAKSQKMQSAASQKHPAQLKEAKYKIRSDAKPESAFLLVSVSFKRRWQVCQMIDAVLQQVERDQAQDLLHGVCRAFPLLQVSCFGGY